MSTNLMWTRGAIAVSVAVLVAHSLAAGRALAGGNLDTIDMTNAVPLQDDPNVVVVPVVSLRADSRCIPVPYTLNTSVPVLPNPLGPPSLKIEDAGAAIQRSMDSWTRIPTSFIAMRITGNTKKTEDPGFDFVNELRFITDPNQPAGFIGVSPSMSLMRRTTFRAGDDLDKDGDPDVAPNITQCADVDGDGDIEFPAGVYEAGTIIDNDVIFNAAGFRFTVKDEEIDTNPQSVDLSSIATHELGHSHGLSHSPLNQRSGEDGRSATMFPFVDTADPVSERNQASPDSDGIQVSTSLYPEGSARTGPGALQNGDQAAARVFGTVMGSVRAPDGTPVLGANVFCRDQSTKRIDSSTFSGRARLGLDTKTDDLLVLNPEGAVINGNFRLMLRPGTFECGVEAIDGTPVAADTLNIATQLGDVLGEQAFPEEFFNGAQESATETSPGDATPIRIVAGRTRGGVNLITNREVTVTTSEEPRVEPAQVAVGGSSNLIVTAVIPGRDLMDVERAARQLIGPQGTIAIGRAEFRTAVGESSVVPVFSSASLNRCSLKENLESGAPELKVDLMQPLQMQQNFVAEDDDFSPLFLSNGVQLASDIFSGLRSGAFQDVCLVLRFPNGPFPGQAKLAPFLIVDSTDQTPVGLSFVSGDDGKTFRSVARNLQFSLGLSLMRPQAQMQNAPAAPAPRAQPEPQRRRRGRQNGR